MSRPHRLHRRALASGLMLAAASVAVPALAAVARPEKSRLTVVAGAKAGLTHLPLVIADQLGFFRSEGLSVDIADVPTHRKALEIYLEGGAEVCAGLIEHTLQLQARGQSHQAFVLQARAPQLAFGISTRTMASYRTVADLAGKRIGLAESGSMAGLLARLVLQRSGLRLDEVVLVEMPPAAAVAALRSAQVDALAQPEPVMSVLEQRAEVRIVADTRTLKGTAEVFGGPMPSTCLHASTDFLQRHPGTCQALAHGIVHALKWLQTAGPGDILKAVPEAFLAGDRAVYLAAFNKVRETLSPDGLLSVEGARNALRVLASVEPGLRPERLDIERTFTNEFARRAKERFRA